MPLFCVPQRRRYLGALVGTAIGAAACSPALDWRELRSADGKLVFTLPCKPSQQERQVQLAGSTAAMSLQACAAGGQTWGLASADVADPARVNPALAELAAAAAANVRGQVLRDLPAHVSGATPNPASRRLLLQGVGAEGKTTHMHLAVFAHGTRIYQATALGAQVADEAADTFFGALRVQP